MRERGETADCSEPTEPLFTLNPVAVRRAYGASGVGRVLLNHYAEGGPQAGAVDTEMLLLMRRLASYRL